jgi:hypothetical protein
MQHRPRSLTWLLEPAPQVLRVARRAHTSRAGSYGSQGPMWSIKSQCSFKISLSLINSEWAIENARSRRSNSGAVIWIRRQSED